MGELSIEWLRPEAWLLLPAWLAALWFLWRTQAGHGKWQRWIDRNLLEHVVEGDGGRSQWLPLALGILAGVLLTLALAGPSWRTTPLPLYRDLSARVIVLDLSPSMMSIDAEPNRLTLAKTAVTTLLRDAQGQQLGLVVFAGDAFTVAPLTRDAATLVHLLATLDIDALPRRGTRVDLGLAHAGELLDAADVARGEVFLVGDSMDSRALPVVSALRARGFPVSVVATGSERGGPVRLSSGSFAMQDDEVVVAKLDLDGLKRLARDGGGTFHLAADMNSLHRTLVNGTSRSTNTESSQTARMLPVDDGYWFVLLLLPCVALLFRRGWVLSLFGVALVLPADEALAWEWRDLWQRADQQAAAIASDPGRQIPPTLELELVDNPSWRAIVLYRAGQYERAAALLGNDDTPRGHYNRANALALSGNLAQALSAYDRALALNPDMHDALFNRALVREALAREREQRGNGQDRETSTPESGDDSGDGSAPEDNVAEDEQSNPNDTDSTDQTDSTAAAPGEESDRPPGTEEETAEAQASTGLTGEEILRLEGLLARIPDKPGTLLRNRFRIEYKLRTNKHGDTGGAW